MKEAEVEFFSEINVQSSELNKLHKLHLRYVLGLASHVPKDDFGSVPENFIHKPEEYGPKETEIFNRRFANRMAYRIGARLTLNPKSPLYDRIQFFGSGRSKRKKPIDAYDWVSHCYPWVLQFDELIHDEDNFVRVVQNYFKAWEITANTDPKTGKSYHDSAENNRWDEGQGLSESKVKVHSRLFLKIAFKPILALFPLTFELSDASFDSNDKEMIDAFIGSSQTMPTYRWHGFKSLESYQKS